MSTTATGQRKRKGEATELKDLDVSRVDGVDRPATGRKFLLFKSREEARRAGVITSDQLAGRLPRTRGIFTDVVFGVAKSQPVEPASREFDAADDFERPLGSDDELWRPGRGPAEVDTAANDAEEERMAAALQSTAGTVEDATRSPAYAVDSFLDPTGEWSQRPVKQYEIVTDPGIAAPRAPNFQSGGTESGIVTPADFRAPQPKSIRMGDGHVIVKGGAFWKGTVAHVSLERHEVQKSDVDWSEIEGERGARLRRERGR